MAELVKRQMKFSVVVSGCIIFCGFMISSASAQSLPDPTRPPRLGQVAGSIEASTGPVLQSVLLSPGGRSIAIISGQTVRLGEQYGSARLVKITESEVVLRSGNELQTLKLFPNIGKRLLPNRDQQNSVQRK